jgi:endonuclease/exonuclease/phosphatase family metal-dependent hydrolase
LGICGHAFADTLRIVDWNIEDDINGYTTPRPGMNTVLEGVGNEIIGGDAQPIDIMALEETTSNATTVQPILNMLNGDYIGADYQMSSYQGTESGNDASDGNGPNAIVYNANTVQLLASVGVGTPGGSSDGEYRQVVRYEFEPIGSDAPFYVYVSHMKSGSTSADATDRGEEATIIRTNEATLPANASVLYVGDLNSNPPEAEFTEFTAAGDGEAYDPLSFSTTLQNLTDSTTSLRYRDDYQLMTQNILGGTGAIDYVSGSLQAFGNNGSVSGSVNSGSNTDLAYMTTGNGYNPTQSQILSALTTASDHLPNVADYTFAPVPEPTCAALAIGGTCVLLVRRRRSRANAV